MEEAYHAYQTEDEIGRKIQMAFLPPNSSHPSASKIRTLYGIAYQTNLSIEQIRNYIERHPHDFERLSTRIGGRDLYRLRQPSQAVAD